MNLHVGEVLDQILAQVAFVDVDFPELQFSVVQLALLDSAEHTLIDHVFTDINFQVHLLVRDLLGDDAVQEHLLIVVVLHKEVVDLQDILQVVEDVDHVVPVGRQDRFDLHTVDVNHLLAIVHHDVPSFQIRSCKK